MHHLISPMRQTIYAALEDVLGDNFTPEELERLADVILKALRRADPSLDKTATDGALSVVNPD